MLKQRLNLGAPLIALILTVAAVGQPASALPPVSGIETTNVFRTHTDGYDYYRIPTIVQAPNGDLLAFGEGRLEDVGDHGNIDLVMRRSLDYGETWLDMQILADNGEVAWHNPVPVVDKLTGTIHLLSSHATQGGIARDWIQSSTDNGATWSAPREITDMVTPAGGFRAGPAPSHAIQPE